VRLGNNNEFYIDTSLNSIGIGMNNPGSTRKLNISATGFASGIGVANASVNQIWIVGNANASGGNWNTTSDIRFKDNIKTLPKGNLAKLINLRGVSFYWSKDKFSNSKITSKKQLGVIAQEVEKFFPELVTENNGEAESGETYKSVSYDKFVPIFIEAIKEQQIKIKELEARIQELENK